jgi:hypothetical protein
MPAEPRAGCRRHLDFFFGSRWLSALPAAVFESLPVLPSRSTFDAALAAFALVFFVMRITSSTLESLHEQYDTIVLSTSPCADYRGTGASHV